MVQECTASVCSLCSPLYTLHSSRPTRGSRPWVKSSFYIQCRSTDTLMRWCRLFDMGRKVGPFGSSNGAPFLLPHTGYAPVSQPQPHPVRPAR
jgi:hypothetical protein